jgi:hypothetical protein
VAALVLAVWRSCGRSESNARPSRRATAPTSWPVRGARGPGHPGRGGGPDRAHPGGRGEVQGVRRDHGAPRGHGRRGGAGHAHGQHRPARCAQRPGPGGGGPGGGPGPAPDLPVPVPAVPGAAAGQRRHAAGVRAEHAGRGQRPRPAGQGAGQPGAGPGADGRRGHPRAHHGHGDPEERGGRADHRVGQRERVGRHHAAA